MQSLALEFIKLTKDLLLKGDLSGSRLKINDNFINRVGLSSKEVTKRTISEFIMEEDRPQIKNIIQNLKSGKSVQGIECRMLTQKGAFKWVRWDFVSDSERKTFFAVGKDIHLEKENEIFQTLFKDNSPIGLNLCDLNGTWLSSNPAFLKMIGYSKEEADGGLTYWQLTPEKYSEQEKIQLIVLEQTGKYGPYEKEFIRKDGTLIPVRLNGFIIQKDGKPYIWSIIEDITVEKQYKDEIDFKKALFEVILENIPTAVFIKDVNKDFEFTLWNKACEEMLKIPRDKIIGKKDSDLWPEELVDLYQSVDTKVMQEGKMIDIPVEPARRSDGADLLVHTKKVPLSFTKGSKSSKLLLGIAEDITELKKLEKDLLNSIQLRDEFISIASHELKTPLSSLFLQIELLQRGLNENLPVENALIYSAKALKSCRQLKMLIDELLDITQIRANKITVNKSMVNLQQEVEKVISLMAEELQSSGSSINFVVKETIIALLDVNRINQIIQNLLSNAIKYGEGKPICVTIGKLMRGQTQNLYVEVRDQGIGIPLESLQTIFECYQRVGKREKISGLGLGLYIVRQLVQAHDGSVRVESAPGQGSTFIFEIPY